MPELPLPDSSHGFARAMLAKARRDRMTWRDLYNLTGAARGHWVICGTPATIADTLQAWFAARAATASTSCRPISPAASTISSIMVVPILQERGLFRRDYAGDDPARPPRPGTAAQPAVPLTFPLEPPAPAGPALRRHTWERFHENRRGDVLHRLLDAARQNWPWRWRSAASTASGRRSIRISRCVRRVLAPERRRAAEAVLRRDGSLRDADRGGGGDARRCKLGTGICLVVQRDPIQTAKSVASIDRISDGRFLFGVGNGWNQEEIENHGTVFATRHKLARERIEAMKVIWTQSKPEYHGEFVDFEPMMTWPKPVQKPHPPVIVGGAFPWGAKRAVRYGDGWMPHRVRQHYADVAALIPQFRELAAEAGRTEAELPITIWGVQEDRDALLADRDLGVDRVILSLAAAKRDVILPQLDRWAALVRAVA